MSAVIIVGYGYVGHELSRLFEANGLDVYPVDPYKHKEDSGIYDSIASAERVARSSLENITFIIAVPTPLDSEGNPDVSAIAQAGEAVGNHLRSGDLVVLESTTFPGTTGDFLRPILEKLSKLKAGSDFSLCFSSERVDPGRVAPTLREVPKVVGGFSKACGKNGRKFFESSFDEVILVDSCEVAELSKLIENTYRLVNVSVINQISHYCSVAGIDVRAAIEAASTKPYGFSPFFPSIGAGGHCIPIDPAYLTWSMRKLGVATSIIDKALEVNNGRFKQVLNSAISKYHEELHSLPRSILICGATYKANISDYRESKVLEAIPSILSDYSFEHFEVMDSKIDKFPNEHSGVAYSQVPMRKKYDLALLTVLHDCDLHHLGQISVKMGFDVTLRGTPELPARGWRLFG